MDFFSAVFMNIVALGTVLNFQTNISQISASNQHCRLQYSRDFLLQCGKSAGTLPTPVGILPEIRAHGAAHWETLAEVRAGKRGWEGDGQAWPSRPGDNRQLLAGRVRKRGRRGGVRQRLRRRGLRRLPLPPIILGNVQSLRNKIDELQANVECIRDYKNACVIALTETWLKEQDMGQDYEIDGFGQPIRLDRDEQLTGKSHGGGVALYVNQRWCKTVLVRESLCAPNIELLSISLRPFYLPREIPQIFLTVVYIHPKANVAEATATIVKLVHRLQTKSPDAPHFILGDFNACCLKKPLGHYYQYINCPTRHGKALDLCYGTIKGAYKSYALPPLGSSDHNCVLLAPVYQSTLKRGKIEHKEVAVWTDSAIRELNGCLYSTDWDVFINACTDLDELTDTVTSYICHMEESIIPRKTIKLYPNNKPWVNKSLRNVLNQKKLAFQQGDTHLQREAHKLVKREIKLAKIAFKNKVEGELKNNNSRFAWQGIKSMVGIQGKKKGVFFPNKSDADLARELNQFYLRFDHQDFSEELSGYCGVPEGSKIQIDEMDVWKILEGTDPRKGPGPDGMSGRLLRNCGLFLSDIFSYIFRFSLSQMNAPLVWKESVIVPVAKIPSPKELNDFRPVALTSLVMKGFEKIVKRSLLGMSQSIIDPLQFAYQAGKGVEDATATLLDLVLGHLEGTKTHVLASFIDFSSAFNCMQPHILASRLSEIPDIDAGTIGWLVGWLTRRPQRVRVNNTLSTALTCSTGSPQGCVLSPLLFILYTNCCCSTYESSFIIKYADDSVILSLLQDHEMDHGPVLDKFADWCEESFLQLNGSKTKNMRFDFRRNRPTMPLLTIKGSPVETVSQYKYLGTILDERLTFEPNTDRICKKANQRLFYLRKLRTFQVERSLMRMFYSSFVKSVFTFSMICWFGNLSLANKNRLSSIIKQCRKIIGTDLDDLGLIYQVRCVQRAKVILADPDHPLNKEFRLLPSGRRMSFTRKARSNRYLRSFVPLAVKYLNQL